MPTPCVLRSVVEVRLERGVMWDGTCGSSTLHSTRWDVGLAPDDQTPASIDDADHTGVACDRCGTPVPWEAEVLGPCGCGDSECTRTSSNLKRFGSTNRVYDTEDGKLHPGDMYWTDHGDRDCFHWDNCPGRHLHVILPNRHPWDIDSRANNCGLPEDREHRCWVREGEPPNVSVTKNGKTCAAGAGSIASGDYHGFLTAGVLTP